MLILHLRFLTKTPHPESTRLRALALLSFSGVKFLLSVPKLRLRIAKVVIFSDCANLVPSGRIELPLHYGNGSLVRCVCQFRHKGFRSRGRNRTSDLVDMSHTRYHLRYPAMCLRLSRVSPMPVIAAMNNYSWSAFIRGRWVIVGFNRP